MTVAAVKGQWHTLLSWSDQLIFVQKKTPGIPLQICGSGGSGQARLSFSDMLNSSLPIVKDTQSRDTSLSPKPHDIGKTGILPNIHLKERKAREHEPGKT